MQIMFSRRVLLGGTKLVRHVLGRLLLSIWRERVPWLSTRSVCPIWSKQLHVMCGGPVSAITKLFDLRAVCPG